MKKSIPCLGALVLLAAASVSGSAKSRCMQDARSGFQRDLGVCKEAPSAQDRRQCVKAALDKARAAKLSCRNS